MTARRRYDWTLRALSCLLRPTRACPRSTAPRALTVKRPRRARAGRGRAWRLGRRCPLRRSHQSGRPASSNSPTHTSSSPLRAAATSTLRTGPPRLAPCAGGGRPRTARPKRAPTPPSPPRPFRPDDRWLLAKLRGPSVDTIEQHHGHMLALSKPQSRHPGRDRGRIWTNLDATPTAADIRGRDAIPLNQAEDLDEAL